MRFHLAASLAALALAGCSGGNDTTPEPSAPATETATEAAPDAMESEPAAPETQAPAAENTPEPTPTPTPTPKPSATPTAKAEPAAAAAPAPEPVKVAAAGPPPAFARCAVCHSAEKGAPDKIGPNLFGVYGHKAAQGSYNFSDALKNAGLTLDEETLDKWIENPRALVPGNRMSFPGLKNEEKRKAIIEYLKQQQ
ncbi:c-type cytochrome [Novosphingobium mangrovi (ex Huang et al. 2023)]|uniref:C-type cytochrome n=1 Tax=Novosphingobium mangrovi (ex Huang et al. 2023) TaxID=2976432 RepID=A0ABT2I1T4_9SPHN|nr:c-type cytochrome [Novosphingobium mangrovi (ex Huang et al. 2023)]MCT2398755.1 c-type cytochrome [Novosphingobium mangrovi (ex Huang et al. 2023)]